MKKNKIMVVSNKRVLAVILVSGVLLGLFFLLRTNKNDTASVIHQMESYPYQLKKTDTKIYKKYYKDLEDELGDHRVDETNYATLIAKLFVIDYYTLNNKTTNRSIGGVQFIHSGLAQSFIDHSLSTIYKYVENNLNGNRKQELPEVCEVKVKNVTSIEYENEGYQDSSAFEVVLDVQYVVDYGYPKEVSVKIIHEGSILSIVEIH